jgi:hypothetical protein
VSGGRCRGGGGEWGKVCASRLGARGAWVALLGDPSTSLGDTIHAVTLLETERLRLRQFAETDFDSYADLCADAEVMRYVGDRGALSREDAWRQLAMLVGHWALRGYGMWAVDELTSGAFVGRVGLHYPEGWPEPELAWTIDRRFWGGLCVRGCNRGSERSLQYAWVVESD